LFKISSVQLIFIKNTFDYIFSAEQLLNYHQGIFGSVKNDKNSLNRSFCLQLESIHSKFFLSHLQMSKHIMNGNNLGSTKVKAKKKQKSSPLVTVMKEWSPKSKPQPKLEVQNIVEYSEIHKSIERAF